MRRSVIPGLACVVALGLAPSFVTAGAEAASPALVGSFSAPFRSDGFAASSGYDATTGCKPSTNKDTTHPSGIVTCLPAGATVVVMSDGRILYWNALEGFENIQFSTVNEAGGVSVDDQSQLLTLNTVNPAASTWANPSPLRGDPTSTRRGTESLFCSDQVQLADGRILAAGGTDWELDPAINAQFGVSELNGLKKTRIFNPADNTWTESGSMTYGRWYPALVTLPNGKVFVAGGVTKLLKPLYPDRPTDSGRNVVQTETYDPAAGQWTPNGTGGNRTLPLFPRLHLLPDGHVFYDAAGQDFNPMGEAYDEALWNIAGSYNPATKSWTDLGVPGLNTSDPLGTLQLATKTDIAFRGSTFNQQLLLKSPYDSASFLTAGGVLGPTPGSWLPTDSTRIDTVTINGATETLGSIAAGKLNQRRWYSSGVTLPDGSVLAFNGANIDEVATPGIEMAIHQSELFTPTYGTNGNVTGGSWQNIAISGRDRTYHNAGVLLPTGQVLVSGNAPISTLYYKTMTLPGGFANNFHDASFEIYNPPYLFRGTRPTITSAPATVTLGSPLSIGTTGAVSSVRLVRNPAVTHLVDGDQRVVDLPIVSQTGSGVTVAITANHAVLPPGPYMLFVGSGSGNSYVPSVAKQVMVG